MPELSNLLRQRLAATETGESQAHPDADVLTASRFVSEYFEKVAAVSGNPKLAANWVSGELMGALKSGETESKLEQAAKRLELAVTRLEHAIGPAGGDAADSKRLVAALAEAKAEYSALEQTTS